MNKIITILILACAYLTLPAQTPELRIPAAHECSEYIFSKDDQTLVTLGKNEVKIWDLNGPYLLKTLKWKGMDTLYTMHLFFTPDQQRLVIHVTGLIRFINLRTLEWENTQFKIPEYANTVLSLDGKTLYAFGFDGQNNKNTFNKIDLNTGKATKITEFSSNDKDEPGGYGFTISAELSPDGSKILAAGFERTGLLFDANTGKILKKFGAPLPMFFLPNGNIITNTYLDYDDEKASSPNPRYQVEEYDGNTYKSLRKSNLTFKNDDFENDDKIMRYNHDHHNKIIYTCADKFHVFDVKTWAFSERRTLEKNRGVEISNTGKFAFSTSFETFSLETGRLLKKIGFFPYSPFNLANATMGESKGIFAGYKHLFFDPKGFRINLLPVLEGCDEYNYLQRSIYRLLPAQKKVLMVGGVSLNNYLLKSYTLGDDRSAISDISIEEGVGRSVMEIRAYDDNTVLVTDSDRFFTLDSRNWKQKQQVIYGDDWFIDHFSRGDEGFIIERSPLDRSKVIVHLKNETEGAEKHRIASFDLIQKRMIWNYDENTPLSNPVFAEGGKQVWVMNQTGNLLKLDAQTGKIINKGAEIAYSDNFSTISPSSKYIINKIAADETVFGITQINIVEVSTGQLKFALKQQRLPYSGVLFFDNDRFLLTYDEDLKIWDVATGKLLARVVLIEDGNDWIVCTPDGRFDGSSGGLKQMYYIKGRDQIPLEQLYEGFYTPNLLYDAMYGEGLKSVVPIDFNNLKTPPTVRIVNKTNTNLRNLEVEDENVPNYESAQKTAILSVEADGKEEKIVEMRLYQNGKLLNDGTRGFKPVVAGGNQSQRDFEVVLLPGENRFRAIAINNQRTESRAEEITIQYKTTAEEKKKMPGITLYTIIVGVNQYKNSKYNLNYAEADATALRDQLKNNCGSVVAECKDYFILNDKAVKEGILTALEQVSATAKAEDLFVFYFAGHGVMNEAQTFYLVPNDVTQIYGNEGALAQKGISAQDLKEYSTKIKAQKQVFILDACHSSGALQAFTSRGAAEEKAIAQLARSTGTHWLTAAGSEQYASEFAQLGHGVFTFALLEGFKGAADRNGDGKVTIKEMDAYLQDQVPILTEKYKGTAQYPSSYGFGQDFPIGIIR
jgi:WD40 repeat protein